MSPPRPKRHRSGKGISQHDCRVGIGEGGSNAKVADHASLGGAVGLLPPYREAVEEVRDPHRGPNARRLRGPLQMNAPAVLERCDRARGQLGLESRRLREPELE